MATGRTWTRTSIVGTYLHEVAHRLLDKHQVNGHDERFGAVLLTLIFRAAAVEPKVAETFHHFYDLQDGWRTFDEPRSTWQPRSLAWCLATAEELAPRRDMTAEAATAEVASKHVAFVAALEQAPVLAERAEARRRSQQMEAVARWGELKASRQLWRAMAAVFFALSVTVIVISA
jgi:hypothetical protein